MESKPCYNQVDSANRTISVKIASCLNPLSERDIFFFRWKMKSRHIFRCFREKWKALANVRDTAKHLKCLEDSKAFFFSAKNRYKCLHLFSVDLKKKSVNPYVHFCCHSILVHPTHPSVNLTNRLFFCCVCVSNCKFQELFFLK